MYTEAEYRLSLALEGKRSRQGQELVNARLSRITRYKGLEMIHPSNVLDHQEMVAFISLNVANIWTEDVGFFKDIKPSTVLRMGRHHDDHEIDPVIGDVTADLKEGMDAETLQALRVREHMTHEFIGRVLYDLDPASVEYEQYMQDKHELEELSTLEAQSVKIADTLHATWEVLHECLSGNTSFYPVLSRYKERSDRLAMRAPLWEVVRSHKGIQLDSENFPTAEQVATMPPITQEQIASINAEDDSWYEFVDLMHNPLYPAWYKTGFDIALLRYGPGQIAGKLFPNWRTSFYPDEDSH